MEQTIIQIGNSSGILIPAELLKKFGLKKGSKVWLNPNKAGESILISKSKVAEYPITPEFLKWLDSFNKKYKKDLTDLANK